MKRRLLSIVLVVAMIMSMAPVTVLAADDVTEVTTYSELSSALAAGGTVTLGGDVTLDAMITVPSGKDVVLDLNGKTIGTNFTATSGNDMALCVAYGAALTIVDSVGTGVIDGSGVYGAVKMTNTGDNAENGVAKLTVNGGKLIGNYYAIVGNGGRSGTEITINGGYITATGDPWSYGIFHPQNGKLTVNGGKIIAKTGIEMRGGTLLVTGGTIESDATALATSTNDSGSTVSGAAIALSQHNTGHDTSVTVQGGTVSGLYAFYQNRLVKNGTPSGNNISASFTGGNITGEIAVGEKNTAGEPVLTGFISGGTFSTDVSDYVAPGYNFAAGSGSIIADDDALNYVSLGDSMTNGYGLDGYDGNTGAEDYGYGSYANLFAQEYGFNHAKLAMSAMRAEDLHWLLEVDYEDEAVKAVINQLQSSGWNEELWYSVFTNGDYWTWDQLVNNYRFDVAAYCIEGKDNGVKFDTDVAKTTYTDIQALTIVAKYAQESVKDADVVSLGMGNGNFGVFMFGRILEAIGFAGEPSDAMVYDVENAIRECDAETQEKIRELMLELNTVMDDYLGGMGFAGEAVEALKNTVLYTAISYVLNYAGSVEAILQLNPDAEIIQVALMNTYKSDAVVEGITIGDLLDVVFIPLNAYIAALPTYMQATQNSVYADAKFYYAEAPYVECLVDEYGVDFEEKGVNSLIRDRFVQSIVVDEEGKAGMVWGLLDGVKLVDDVTLTEITLAEIVAYDKMVDTQKAAYAADPTTTQKAVSIAVYLAFENAIIASKNSPVTLDSVMGLGGLDFEMFGPVMADFFANANNCTEEQLTAACTVVAAQISSSLSNQEITADTIKGAYKAWKTEDTSDDNPYADFAAYKKTIVGGVDELAMLLALPTNLSASLQKDTTVSGLLALFARCVIGNGLGGHPSAAGHNALFEAVRDAYANEWTAEDETTENIQNALDTALYLITEYYDEAYAYAYDYAVEAGYIDTAVATLEDIKTTLAGLTLDEATPEFQAELAAAVADAINTITELQNLLLEADELDDATLQKALELVAALEKTLAHIDDLLVTAGEDTVDGLLNKWETEWKHALVDTIETIAKEAAEYLKEMLGEAYDAAVGFLSDLLAEYGPKAVQAAYDFLYNNPDKVVAFIKEYYDDAGAFLAKYHEEILMLIGFVASEYGDEIVDYVKNNYEDIIATMLCLLEEYGDEAGALLQVYADYLGWCQPVQDALDDLEAAAKGMKEDLLAALEALKAELEKLYAELEAAEEDIKAEIEEAIKAVEAAIEAIENAIEAVEGLIEAIEDLIAAVESGVHETIVEALENLKAALDAVNEAIAVLEEAVAIAKEVIDVVIVAVEVVAEAVEALTEVVEAIPAIIEEAKAIAAEIDAAINDMFAKIQQAIADIQAALYSACYAVISKCEVGEELVYVALGGATVANGGYVDAVDEYVGADRTINAGQAEGVAYADQLDYVLGHAADIANADLITYQMDANEMVKTLVDAIWSVNVANDYTSPDWSSFIDTEEVVATVEEVKAKVLEVKAELADYLDEETLAWIAEAEAEILAELDAYIDEEAIEEVRPYVESVAYSMVSYSVGVAEAAEAINTINPDAVVLLLGMYNTLEGTSVIMNGEEVDLGEFFTYVVEAVDIYDLVYAVISGNATVVEICEAPVEGVGSLDIDNVMSTMENAAAALAWMEAVENNYAVDHSYIAGQIESVLTVVEHTEVVDAAIEATCTEPGLTEGSHCSVCGKVFVAQEVIPATGHVAGEAVKENEVAAGCTTDGSYDTVVYCSVCGEELSRETTTVPATGHIDENGDGKCDNCGEDLGGSTPDIPSVPSTPVVDDKCDGGADCPSRAFSDLAAALDVEPTVWWHEATDYVIENGLMNGMGDGLFEPNTTTTRAMIVTTLYRIEGAPAVDAESAYTDVAEGMWYTDAIIWATENGIVKGYGDDTFGPMDNVTREQIATIFHRYAEYKGMATSEKADLAEYTDAAEVSGWALEAMQWANECGLMIGRTETTLVPAGETTRAEMAMLLFRWCEEIAK